MLATVYGEARGEPVEGQIGVGWVIQNRTGSGRTLSQVVLAPFQFSCWQDTGANGDAVYAFAEELLTKTTWTTDIQAKKQLNWVTTGILLAELADNTHGATHYLEASLYAANPPAWAVGKPILATLGHHVFLTVT